MVHPWRMRRGAAAWVPNALLPAIRVADPAADQDQGITPPQENNPGGVVSTQWLRYGLPSTVPKFLPRDYAR